MSSFRAISLNGVDGAVVSGNTFEQGGNASENVCGCCTVVEADPATRCANVSILKTDDLDDATRSAAAAAATKPRVPFSAGSAPVSFFIRAEYDGGRRGTAGRGGERRASGGASECR